MRTHRHKIHFFLLLGFVFVSLSAQNIRQEKKDIKESKILLNEAAEQLNGDQFPLAEADFRKSIAIDPKNEIGKYNLGNAYYDKKLNESAKNRYTQAAAVAKEKSEKHKAFHNLGNTFMNAKSYKEAVEAYKEALRNEPTDDETRYNLALAKKMLEEQQKNGGGDGDDKNKKDQENKDQNNDQKEKNKENEKKKEDNNGDNKEKEQDNKDKDDQKGDNKENKKPEDQNNQQNKQQKPIPGKLSTQQIKNLLDAMNNEEKKVQDKINAEKQKGAKVKSNKDW